MHPYLVRKEIARNKILAGSITRIKRGKQDREEFIEKQSEKTTEVSKEKERAIGDPLKSTSK